MREETQLREKPKPRPAKTPNELGIALTGMGYTQEQARNAFKAPPLLKALFKPKTAGKSPDKLAVALSAMGHTAAQARNAFRVPAVLKPFRAAVENRKKPGK